MGLSAVSFQPSTFDFQPSQPVGQRSSFSPISGSTWGVPRGGCGLGRAVELRRRWRTHTDVYDFNTTSGRRVQRDFLGHLCGVPLVIPAWAGPPPRQRAPDRRARTLIAADFRSRRKTGSPALKTPPVLPQVPNFRYICSRIVFSPTEKDYMILVQEAERSRLVRPPVPVELSRWYREPKRYAMKLRSIRRHILVA